jgi:hypothetical protein
MDANELRALQAPLKKRYREDPVTARTPARAEATLDLGAVACRIRSWAGEITAGLHPATGGDGNLARFIHRAFETAVWRRVGGAVLGGVGDAAVGAWG